MITFSDPSSHYFGVYPDLRQEEFVSVDYAFKAGAFAVIEILEKTRHNGNFKNSWYDYKIHSENPTFNGYIQYLKWRLEIAGAFATTYGSEYDHTEVLATFIDPYGKKIELGRQGIGRGGIGSSLRKLKDMASYESYQNFNLSCQVKKLEEEVLKLKKQILDKE